MKTKTEGRRKSGDDMEDLHIREFKQKVRIGAFFVTIFLILALFVMFVGDIGILLKKKGYPLYVSFDTVIGLAKRSYVRMAGLKIGYVKDIVLKGTRPEVELLIDPQVQIRQGSKAALATAGLIGEKYVEIVPGEEGPVLEPGSSLLPIEAFDIEQMGEMFLSLGEEVKTLGERVKILLGDGKADTNVGEVLEDFSALTAELKEFLAENRKGVREGIQNTTRVVDGFESEVEKIARELEDFISVLRNMVDENRESVRVNLENIKALIEKTEEALAQLNESLDKINKGEGTLGKLVSEPALYNRAEEAMDNLEHIMDPLVSLKTRFGLRTEYLSGSRLLKNTFQVDIWGAGNKFVSGQAVYDPWMDGIRFSIQGGLRFGPLVPRLGILESKVGAGLDAYAFQDRLRITLEGFDFNRETSPLLRAWTSFAATKHLSLILGINDFSLAANREWYFGLGLGL